MLVVPEFILHKVLQHYLDLLRSDYEDASIKENSFLLRLVGSAGFQRYGYKEQALEIFITRDKESPRFLTIDLGFNMKQDRLPTISIVTPSETASQGFIGNGQESEMLYIETVSGQTTSINQTDILTQRMSGTYDIVITSQNSNETVLIYHVIRSLLKVAIPVLHLNELQNIKFSGQDLAPYKEVAPEGVFVRALRLALEYETRTPTFEKNPYIRSVIFTDVIESS